MKIISGSWDGTIDIWDAPSCNLENTSEDETIRGLWDAQSDKLENTLGRHAGEVYSAAYSPDGTKIVSGSWDVTIGIWDAPSCNLENTSDVHTGLVSYLAFSSNGSKIVSGSEDKTIRVWDALSGKLENTLEGHTGTVTSVTFSSDGSKIVSGSKDKTVRVWDALGGTLGKTLKGHTEGVDSVTIKGTNILTSSNNESITWDAQSGRLEDFSEQFEGGKWYRSHSRVSGLYHIPEGYRSEVQLTACSSDGTKMISGSRDKAIRIWNIQSRLHEGVLSYSQ